MSVCEVCGNDYAKSFDVIMQGKRHSFECAIEALAPRCANCGIRIVGHGLESGDRFFCCRHCAEQAGVGGLKERA
jgi:hypothetical protein